TTCARPRKTYENKTVGQEPPRRTHERPSFDFLLLTGSLTDEKEASGEWTIAGDADHPPCPTLPASSLLTLSNSCVPTPGAGSFHASFMTSWRSRHAEYFWRG